MQRTRSEVHRWGHRNRVTFDASKGHVNIIHPSHGHDETFKFLGCPIDEKLTMGDAVDYVCVRARPKIKALLRSRRYYNVPDLIVQFKTPIWGLIEFSHGNVMHASETFLSKIEDLQRGFIRQLPLTEEMAFLDHNLAPLCLRRDIGILDFLHERVLGQCHPAVIALLPFSSHSYTWRHSKQLETQLETCVARPQLYWRSLYGLIHVYNRLPTNIIDAPSVKEFQKRLTAGARMRCVHWDPEWKKAFRDCAQLWQTLRHL